MIFTGNPGSAKTTVARRIAEILKDEGVLRTGAFVECGRDDLVSKYVGWTAINVAGKFEEASGGILFIDEAYSLVDDSNSFGTEAINTIVKYMEDRRDDVICVFAGYPQKMKKFLENNEGLRSRIAFHLNFPDYTADELVRILDVMVEDRGYSISTDARKKCYDMFSAACRNPDFGNGRYVRNTLEQSIMRQSRRLYDRAAEDITKEQMMSLEEEDFAASDNPYYQAENTKKYGF